MQQKHRPKNWLLIKFRKYHGWLGVFFSLTLVTTGLTGIALNHEEIFFGKKREQHGDSLNLEVAITLPVNFQQALHIASAQLGSRRQLELIQLKQDKQGLYYKFKSVAGDGQPQSELTVDANSGEVSLKRDYSIIEAPGTPQQQQKLNIKKLFLDIHTGKILALPGKLLVDFTAVSMLLLVISGMYLWYTAKKRKAQAEKNKQPNINAKPS